MSIWGPGPHENDDAADWLSAIEEEPGLFALNEAFDEVLRSDDAEYIEVAEAAEAVCAACIVCALLADSFDGVPLSAHAALLLRQNFGALVPSARTSLAWRASRSLGVCCDEGRSELAELIQQSPHAALDWRTTAEHMQRRLAGAASPAPPPA